MSPTRIRGEEHKVRQPAVNSRDSNCTRIRADKFMAGQLARQALQDGSLAAFWVNGEDQCHKIRVEQRIT